MQRAAPETGARGRALGPWLVWRGHGGFPGGAAQLGTGRRAGQAAAGQCKAALTTGQDRVSVGRGIAPGDRLAAAALWWRGLGRQVLPHAASRAGIGWARAALRPQATLAARDARGRLVGLAGLRDGAGGLIDWRAPRSPLLGPLAAGLGRAGLMLWRAGPPTTDLVLDGLAVHPRAQRAGVARALIRAALAEAGARGRPGLTVEVLASNRTARRLYASEGFVTVARRRPGHGRLALVMRRGCGGEGGLPTPAAPPISGAC